MSPAPLALEKRSPLRLLVWAVPVAALLVVLPWAIDPYPTILLAYGLVMAAGFRKVSLIAESPVTRRSGAPPP